MAYGQEDLYIDEIYKQLDPETQKTGLELFRQLLDEQKRGQGKPRTSIIKVFVNMEIGRVQQCIEMYEQQTPGAAVTATPPAAVTATPAAQAEVAQDLPQNTKTAESTAAEGDSWSADHDDWQYDQWARIWDQNEWGAADWKWGSQNQNDWKLDRETWDADPWGPYDSTSAASLGDDGGGGSASKLYVANLPLKITEAQLQKIFSKHGKIKEIHLMWGRQKHTGKSSAMVLFYQPDDAENCRKAMSNYVCKKSDGPLIVKYADFQQQKGKGKGKSKGKGKGETYVAASQVQLQ